MPGKYVIYSCHPGLGRGQPLSQKAFTTNVANGTLADAYGGRRECSTLKEGIFKVPTCGVRFVLAHPEEGNTVETLWVLSSEQGLNLELNNGTIFKKKKNIIKNSKFRDYLDIPSLPSLS